MPLSTCRMWDFNPRAPCGARQDARIQSLQPFVFQSTRPVRGATSQSRSRSLLSAFQSTRPVRGATGVLDDGGEVLVISIHAPRAGRDTSARERSSPPSNFNPRAPCGARPGPRWIFSHDRHFNPRAPCGARPRLEPSNVETFLFQSTRPVRGATIFDLRKHCVQTISIHAPRAGRDLHPSTVCIAPDRFQSTRPVRGATDTKDNRSE